MAIEQDEHQETISSKRIKRARPFLVATVAVAAVAAASCAIVRFRALTILPEEIIWNPDFESAEHADALDNKDGHSSNNNRRLSGVTPLSPPNDFKRDFTIPHRAFPTWAEMYQSAPLPCYLDKSDFDPYQFKHQISFAREGLLFVKVPKAGSTTFASVAARIAHVVYRRIYDVNTKDVTTKDKPKNANKKLKGPGHKNAKTSPHHKGTRDLQAVTEDDDMDVVMDKFVEPPLPDSNGVCRFRGPLHNWQRLGGHANINARHEAKSFLWTVVRDPADRLISQYFHFRVSRSVGKPNEISTHNAEVISYLQQPQWDNLQLRHIYPHKEDAFLNIQKETNDKKRTDLWKTVVSEAVESYNFIGVLERLDESLVALQLIMGLEAGDVVPLPAKQSDKEGELDWNDRGQCTKFVKSFKTHGVKLFLKSNQFVKEHQEGDFMLHRAANLSLDATIESIGQERFHEALTAFRKARALAEEAGCQDVGPCESEGVPRPEAERKELCYIDDVGCGHKCLDKLFGP